MAAQISLFALINVFLRTVGAKESFIVVQFAAIQLHLPEREIRFTALGNVLKRERLGEKTQDDLILFLNPVNGAEKTLSAPKVISMLEGFFVITLAWLSGNPKTQEGRIIPDGLVEHKMPEVVDGRPQEMKLAKRPRDGVKCVGQKQAVFIIKSP